MERTVQTWELMRAHGRCTGAVIFTVFGACWFLLSQAYFHKFGLPVITMTEDCVDAALAGLDAVEQVTLPSLEDVGLWEQFDKSRLALVPAVNKGSVGSRYNLSR